MNLYVCVYIGGRVGYYKVGPCVRIQFSSEQHDLIHAFCTFAANLTEILPRGQEYQQCNECSVITMTVTSGIKICSDISKCGSHKHCWVVGQNRGAKDDGSCQKHCGVCGYLVPLNLIICNSSSLLGIATLLICPSHSCVECG
jgi:hypothetical protein